MSHRIPVVVDTDLALDDVLAILFLLAHPDISVLAITVSGTGEAHGPDGARNAAGLVALAGADVPVAFGPDVPLRGTHAFPPDWRAAADELYGLWAALPPVVEPPGDALELLGRTVTDADEPVLLITLGPLTNVAQAIRSRPRLAEGLRGIHVMGGALRVPGNLDPARTGIDNRVAEWNLYVDPHAANVVLGSGVPVTFVTLDATVHAPLSRSFLRLLEAERRTPGADFACALLTHVQSHVLSRPHSFWDPLAAAIALDRGLADFEVGNVEVVEEGPASGQLRFSAGGRAAVLATRADGPRFERLFLDVLNGR